MTNRLWSVWAITGYDLLGNPIKYQLNDTPIMGDLFDVSNWADEQVQDVSVLEFEYALAKCFGAKKCEHLRFDKFVPHHPIWECRCGGTINNWSTVCYSCPIAKEIEG